MMRAAKLVRQLYEAYQARDWEASAALLHGEAVVEMPATAERLVGRENVLEFQRRYPEPWGDLSVLRIIGEGDTAAAEIEIVAPEDTFRMAAIWRSADGLLRDGVEYWVTVGGDEPPPTREPARS
ncbi:MAG: nuclear transport factor 2 family protein [Gaiellaceae bacterium MAG52_C11]|nr:nuclear transport factor 2 family protein [Candidatus Gaiellasilicea maunaloa]